MQTATEANDQNLLLERRWTAAELRKLPAAERDAVMRAAAALAEADYRYDPELTAFEAYDLVTTDQ